MTQQPKMVKPDMKGRICLGGLAKGVSSFKITIDKKQRIVLEPFIEIPASEAWLHKNKAVLNQVKQGIKDVENGKTTKSKSFKRYLDMDD